MKAYRAGTERQDVARIHDMMVKAPASNEAQNHVSSSRVASSVRTGGAVCLWRCGG